MGAPSHPSGWNCTFPLGGGLVPVDVGHLGIHARALREENGSWTNGVGQWTIELLEWGT